MPSAVAEPGVTPAIAAPVIVFEAVAKAQAVSEAAKAMATPVVQLGASSSSGGEGLPLAAASGGPVGGGGLDPCGRHGPSI